MILNDFVMLGRTEPVESKKHGPCVCSAGYSRELRSLIRIYPLPFPNDISKWSLCTVPLRRPRDDTRGESWRIDVDGEDIDSAASAVVVHGTVNRDKEFDFLASIAAPSIRDLNDARLSLGIIRPQSIRGFFDRRENLDPAEQLTFFDRREHEGIVHRSDLIPRLEFTDPLGHTSRLSLKEWGCSEWLRKYRNDAEKLWHNLSFDDPAFEHLLFVGNQNHHRSSWLVIDLIKRRVSTQLSLLVA